MLAQLLAPHRRRPLQHARLCRRPAARGAASCSSSHFPVYRTYVTRGGLRRRRPRHHRRARSQRRARRWLGHRRRHLRFPARRADARSHRAAAVRLQPAARAPLRAQAAAVHRADDGEVAGGHRVLSLSPRCSALNEVGGDPTLPALSVARISRAHGAARAEHSPHGLTATATHDTKRGEDARTRILALSEIADEWAEHVAQWRELNARLRRRTRRRPRSPRPAHEYMLYQALIGAWPLAGRRRRLRRSASRTMRSRRRARASSRPAGSIRTRTTKQGLRDFIRAHSRSRRDPAHFSIRSQRFARRAALLGALNSLTSSR